MIEIAQILNFPVKIHLPVAAANAGAGAGHVGEWRWLSLLTLTLATPHIIGSHWLHHGSRARIVFQSCVAFKAQLFIAGGGS